MGRRRGIPHRCSDEKREFFEVQFPPGRWGEGIIAAKSYVLIAARFLRLRKILRILI